MTLGFLGTGAITSAIVSGLHSAGGQHYSIRLSPRNATVASGLAGQFENVEVASSNQDVVDTSDMIVIAVRPQVAEEVLSPLQFSARHIVISLVAGFPVSRIAGLVSPAVRISRAIPLPSAAQRRSPTALHPSGGPAADLFALVGPVFGIATEAELSAFSTATSTMAAYFGFLAQIASWMAQNGVPEQQAREYVARMFAGLADTGLEASHRTFEDLATAHATRGGLNEQLLGHLTGQGVFDILAGGLDAIHRRVTGR